MKNYLLLDSPSQNDEPSRNFHPYPPPIQKPPKPRSQRPSSTPPTEPNIDHIINCSQSYPEKLCVAYYNAQELFSRAKEQLQPVASAIKEKAVYVYERAFEIRLIRDFVVHFVISVVFFVVVLIVAFCFAPRYEKNAYKILVLKGSSNRANKI